MKKYERKKCLHIENDVLLYQKLGNLSNHIYLTMDSDKRCIPGVIYIPEHKLLKNLIEKYNYTQNDMINLASFYHNNFPATLDNRFTRCMQVEFTTQLLAA